MGGGGKKRTNPFYAKNCTCGRQSRSYLKFKFAQEVASNRELR
jgi:hypothetical protein